MIEMGHIRNETMVINGWDAKRVLKAHAAASAIFDEYRMARLVSGLVQHITNGGAAFFISPDGSKENWDSSNQADAARKELIEWLKSPDNENLYLDWALIVLGGDDGEFSITSSS